MGKTKIEWSEITWNPVRGCSRISPGCGGAAGEGGCYAERTAARFSGPGMPYAGLVRTGGKQGPRWTGKLVLDEKTLAAPLSWRKPRRVFVNSMSDLFHESLSDEQIAAVFGVMAACPQHVFQILTKRAERLRDWFRWVRRESQAVHAPTTNDLCRIHAANHGLPPDYAGGPWPLPNVWIGVSVEDQPRADERIPLLLETPAAVRFLSVEPMLEHVDLGLDMIEPAETDEHGNGYAAWAHRRTMAHPCDYACGGAEVPPTSGGIDWVIVGGESGPGARTCDVAWIRSIVEQCRASGVAVFVKQLGARPRMGVEDVPDAAYRDLDANGAGAMEIDEAARSGGVRLRDRKGGDMAEFPEDLRVREWPGGTP